MKNILQTIALSLCATAMQAENTVPLHWVGTAPSTDKAVTFGVPFPRGEVKCAGKSECAGREQVGRQVASATINTDDGKSITADFWPLSYWPDGSVKWGGVSAVIPAGSKGLTVTPGLTPQPPLHNGEGEMVSVRDKQIVVKTGSLTAYIPRSGRAVIDSLVIGTKDKGQRTIVGKGTLVASIAPSPSPLPEGRGEYTALLDSAVVERAGNVRALVKLCGNYLPPRGDGGGALPFTLRLYFFAGSTEIKAVHSFVYDGDQDKDFISSLGMRFEVPMREQMYNRHVAFATDGNGVWTESVQPLSGRRILTAPPQPSPQGRVTDPHTLQVMGKRVPEPDVFDEKNQALLKNWAVWGSFRLSQTTDMGFSVRKRTHGDRPWIGTYSGHRAQGYAFVGDMSGGMGVAVKDFWQSYPATLQVDSANTSTALLTAYLWSPEAEPMDLRHYDHVAHDLNASYEDVQPGFSTPEGIGRTSTLTLLPQQSWPGREEFSRQAASLTSDAPLMATPQYLHEQRAFGIWSLPENSKTERALAVEKQLEDYLQHFTKAVDEHHWYGFWNYGDFMHQYDPVRHQWKYDVGGFAWDNTELSSIGWLWYSFLRTGRADVWKMAEAMSRHTGEVDVYHSGPFAGLGSRHNVSHWGCGAKESRISQAAFQRFYYYLTADERTGDLMEAVTDADQQLYTIDPMRLALPREKYPCTAPARLRIGPDWMAYAGNWFTHYERTLDKKYREKIERGMKSIAKLPNGFFCGPGVLGYDPATGILSYEGDKKVTSTSHLMTIMGGFELFNELMDVIPNKAFEKAYLDHARRYEQMTGRPRGKSFRVTRLKAYAAAHGYPELTEEAWEDMYVYGKTVEHYKFDERQLLPPLVPQPQTEAPGITTNDAALWSLETIYMLEVLKQ